MVTKVTRQYWPNYTCDVGLSGQSAIDGDFTTPFMSGVAAVDDSFTGEGLPRYKAIIKAGKNATTNASGLKSQRYGLGPQQYVFGYTHPSKAPSTARRNSRCVTSSVMAIEPPPSGTAEESFNTNLARSKFSKKVGKVYTQFEGGVFLGELRETLRMIRNPAQALRKGVASYLDTIQKNGRRIKKRPIADRKKWVSGTYLEHAFGWSPFLSDLDAARSYLEERRGVLVQELIGVKASSHSPRVLRADTFAGPGIGVSQISYRQRTIATYSRILQGAVSSRALGTGMINASAMGLSPRHFAPTLWELLPWSFVADYFTNIGDVISGWSNQSLTLAWGRETSIRRSTKELYDQKFGTSLLIVEENRTIPGTLRMESKSFTRVPILAPPVPGFNYEIPGFGLKWLNMAALANDRVNIRRLRLWE